MSRAARFDFYELLGLQPLHELCRKRNPPMDAALKSFPAPSDTSCLSLSAWPPFADSLRGRVQLHFRCFSKQSASRFLALGLSFPADFSKILRMRLKLAASGGKFLVLPDSLERRHAFNRIAQIVRTSGKCGVDFIVGDIRAAPAKCNARDRAGSRALVSLLRAMPRFSAGIPSRTEPLRRWRPKSRVAGSSRE